MPDTIDELWEVFTSSVIAKFNASNSNWLVLSAEEQEITALWKLQLDGYNGGFLQFFCNWAAEAYTRYTRATEALERIHAYSTLQVVRNAYHIIARLEEDERLTALWDIPRYLTHTETEQLDALDRQFWQAATEITQLAYPFYHNKTNNSHPAQ